MRYRLCRRVDQTVLEPAQARLNPKPATQPSRLSRTRPDSRTASVPSERNRPVRTSNSNNPQPEPAATNRSTASTPPRGSAGGRPSTCRQVVPSGLWGASTNADQLSHTLVLLPLRVRVTGQCRLRVQQLNNYRTLLYPGKANWRHSTPSLRPKTRSPDKRQRWLHHQLSRGTGG